MAWMVLMISFVWKEDVIEFWRKNQTAYKSSIPDKCSLDWIGKESLNCGWRIELESVPQIRAH